MTDDDAQKFLNALQQQNAQTQAETRRHFDETASRLVGAARHQFDVSTEAINHEIRLVAEGVASLGERVSREIGRLDEKVDRGFAETQAMIKFSHAELDKRVRMLEDAFNELRLRVDRLEGTTH